MKQKYTSHRAALEIIAEWIEIIAERIIQEQQCLPPAVKSKVPT
jgi:hypothetical protein